MESLPNLPKKSKLPKNGFSWINFYNIKQKIIYFQNFDVSHDIQGSILRQTFFQKTSANGLELDASKQGIQYGEL